MQAILEALRELDRLYTSDTLVEYEQQWQITAQQIQQELPGFTIGYAEVYHLGLARLSDGSMRHVLLPQPGNSG